MCHDDLLKRKTAKRHYFAALRAVKTANLVRVTGFEPAVSWSQTRRDTKLRYTQKFMQLWSNMWSGKFYHRFGKLSRGDKRGTSRKYGAVCDLFDWHPVLVLQLPKLALYQAELRPDNFYII